jgi:oligopeptide/dipeptide ABC transporter ATP-binding protein
VAEARPDLLLEVANLKTHFLTDEGIVRAVDGVSFAIRRGETLGVVGESGCGKSVTALSVMQLLPHPKGRIAEGRILYHRNSGTVDIARLDPRGADIRHLRGNEIAMIFQEPMSSLNPVYTVGEQIAEAIRLHQGLNRQAAARRAVEMLARVHIPDPPRRADEYPHQLSGGMRQRAMIAMALSCNPSLLIADEPTTALDVTIEAQILRLMAELRAELGMALMIITHNMGVIGQTADRVMVMYAGKVVEQAGTVELFYSPMHPYTLGLLESIPRIGVAKRLTPIRGSVPDMRDLPAGCAFAPRCRFALSRCAAEPPPFVERGRQGALCWLHDPSATGASEALSFVRAAKRA